MTKSFRVGEVEPATPVVGERSRRSRRWSVLDISTVAVVVLLLVTVAIGPVFAPDVFISNMGHALVPPGADHWLGTDQQGRDVFWRIIVGTRTTLPAAMIVVAGYAVLGVVIGTLSAIGPGWIRESFQRVTDLGLSIPGIVVALGLAAVMGATLYTAIIALMVTGWPMTARIVAGLVAQTKTQGFVDGAVVLGVSRIRLLLRHILPNALPALWVKWTGDIGQTVLAIGGLSFIGAGAQPPSAEWGVMVADAADYLATAWWAAFFPGLAIVIAAASFSLLGDMLHLRINPELESTAGRQG